MNGTDGGKDVGVVKPLPGKAIEYVTYLPAIECQVKDFFIESMKAVSVQDENGNRQFLRVALGDVVKSDGKNYLRIGIVEVDHLRHRCLVELPAEADSGAGRVWMPFGSFLREKP